MDRKTRPDGIVCTEDTSTPQGWTLHCVRSTVMSPSDRSWDDPHDTPPQRALETTVYTRRRMAALGVLITILVLVGAAGWLASRSGPSRPALTTPTWNAIIEAARTTGDLLLLDPDGTVLADAPGQGLTSAVFTFKDRLGLLGPREITLRSTNLSADEKGVTIELEPQWSVQRMRTHRSMTFLASPATPGNLLLIDGSTGEILDVGAVTEQRNPVLFADSVIADPDHRIFAIGDGRNFQTVVVGFDLSTAAYFPGVPIAVSADLVITATTVGQSSELGVFSVDGRRLNSVSTERPIGSLLTDRELLMIYPDGQVSMLNTDSGAITIGTALSLPRGDEVVWVAPGLDHQRLIVAGRRFVAILDTTGTLISQQVFANEVAMDPGWATWRCWPVGTIDDTHSLIDLENGITLATVISGAATPDTGTPDTGTPDTGTSVTTPANPAISPNTTSRVGINANGCALHLAGPEGQYILTPDTLVPVPITVNRVVLSPDALSAVMVTNDGRARFLTLPDPNDLNGVLVDAVDLGIRRGILAFTNR